MCLMWGEVSEHGVQFRCRELPVVHGLSVRVEATTHWRSWVQGWVQSWSDSSQCPKPQRMGCISEYAKWVGGCGFIFYFLEEIKLK